MAVQPDFIFVAMDFLSKIFYSTMSFGLQRGIAIGVGGVFDVLSGYKNRAPVWVQKMKIIVFRSLQDPIRFFRLGYLFRYVVMFLSCFLKSLKRVI